MNEDHQFITVSEFTKRTGMPGSTVRYHCDKGTIPHTIMSYGKRKKTRMIDYTAFISQMELNTIKAGPRPDRRSSGKRLLALLEEIRDSHRKHPRMVKVYPEQATA